MASLMSILRKPASPNTLLTTGSSKIASTSCCSSTFTPEKDVAPPAAAAVCCCWYRWNVSGFRRWFACDRLIAAISEFDTGGSSLPSAACRLDDGSRSSATPKQSSSALNCDLAEHAELRARDRASRRIERVAEEPPPPPPLPPEAEEMISA